MTQPISEELLQAYYDSFDDKHDVLRNQLLNSIAAKSTSVAVSERGQQSEPTRYSRFAVAALVLVAIGYSTVFNWEPTQAVYGIEHLAERLLTIRSIHIKGWIYRKITTKEGIEKVEKYPTEQYYRRPDCFANTGYGFSHPGNGKPTSIRRSFIATLGEQTIYISDGDKTVLKTDSADSFSTSMTVESRLQQNLANRFLLGPPSEYQKVRTEKFNKITCNVFQYDKFNPSYPTRHRVWINPATGFPVKYASYALGKFGQENPMTENTIKVDVDPPASLFSFRTPKGYQETIIENPQPGVSTAANNKLAPVGEGGSNTTWLATWHSLNINNRAVLACWSQFDTIQGVKYWFVRQPKFELFRGNQLRPCKAITLDTNNLGDKQWRWTLLIPEDGEILGNENLHFSVTNKKTRSFQELKPLRFPRERLQEIILEAQRRTLPDDSEQVLFTLEDLQAKL